MLRRIGGSFDLYPHKVRYMQHGQEYEQWALPDREWWTEFAEKWDHTEIIEFVEVELSEDQEARLDEINQLNIPEEFRSICIEYVLNGKFPHGYNHPLRQIEIKKIEEQQGQEISQREINEIVQERQISDLEIRLLMGGL